MSLFQNLTGTEIAFWLSALFGTLFFFFRVVSMIIGGFGSDIDSHGDIDVDHSSIDSHHSDNLEASDSAFKLLSINSITGFFMMFGWVGLAASRQYQLGIPVSIGVALAAGFVTLYATAFLFRAMFRLASPGDSFKINETLGLNGTVYMQIPASGRGKIQLVVSGMTRYIEAISENGKEIDSFKDITVTAVVDPKTVKVKKLTK